jgi:methionine synthase II (cobalamin-independent)
MDSVRRLRTDQVGSLLRPQALLNARAAWQAGRLSEAGLNQLEDEAILTALRAQEAARQQIYVDGALAAAMQNGRTSSMRTRRRGR